MDPVGVGLHGVVRREGYARMIQSVCRVRVAWPRREQQYFQVRVTAGRKDATDRSVWHEIKTGLSCILNYERLTRQCVKLRMN